MPKKGSKKDDEPVGKAPRMVASNAPQPTKTKAVVRTISLSVFVTAESDVHNRKRKQQLPPRRRLLK